MKAHILGSGTSTGVPLIGCDCRVCLSDDSRNNRKRVSLLIQDERTNLLIDTSPDLRVQLLNSNIDTLNAVLYTHAHADHLHGLDDLRSINYKMGESINVWGSGPTLDVITERFGYAFHSLDRGWGRPSLVPNVLNHGNEFWIDNLRILPFEQIHGRGITTGYRLGNIAYSTDVKSFPDTSIELLAGIKVWILDCVGYQEHPTHAHLDLVLKWVDKVKPERTILTHMSHQIEYNELSAALPKGVEPAYDGLIIEV